MAVSGQNHIESVVATEDLSGAQYKAITTAGAVAAESDTALGLLQNKPQSGEHASVAMSGKMKGVAGAAIAAGARFKATTSGFLITVTSGDGTAVGKNTGAAVASGDTFECFANFVSANTTFNQL